MYQRGEFAPFSRGQSRAPEGVLAIEVTSNYEARAEGLEEGIKICKNKIYKCLGLHDIGGWTDNFVSLTTYLQIGWIHIKLFRNPLQYLIIIISKTTYLMGKQNKKSTNLFSVYRVFFKYFQHL
jgi:hypothetical protein